MPLTSATNAFNATTSALSASTRSEPSNASTVPAVRTSFTSQTASAPVIANAMRFTRSSQTRSRTAQQINPLSNGTRMSNVSIIASPFQLVEFADVHRRERFANARDENAKHHHGNHYVEENPNLDYERHSVGGERDGGEHDAVLDCQQREY